MRISVVRESRNVQHTKKCYATFVQRLWLFADLQGRFGKFVNLALSYDITQEEEFSPS